MLTAKLGYKVARSGGTWGTGKFLGSITKKTKENIDFVSERVI